MNWFLRLLVKWPTEKALRVAALAGLVALALMCLGIFDPRPLSVVISMSVSQAFGAGAFLLFFLSIAADVAQARARTQGGGPGAP
ncbi:MAG: hypothetical protein AMXMBFR34_52680 [Myxococcaceae bacterium]